MKFCVCLLAAGVALVSAAAEAEKYVDPNPYGSYGPAMSKVEGRPMAIEWHLTDRAAIDKATAPEALAANFKNYKGKEWKLKNAARDSGRIGIEALRRCLEVLAETDTILKLRSGDEWVLLEQTVSLLMEALR